MKKIYLLWMVCLIFCGLFAFGFSKDKDTSPDNSNITELTTKAKNGDIEAQYSLGLYYHNKEYNQENINNAVKWFQMAADRGHSESQVKLAFYYMYTFQNKKEAVNLYLKAAKQGNIEGQKSLALCYAIGNGVPINLREMAYWYRKAAEQGDIEAQNEYGDCCRDGYGVSQDRVEAANWYRKAAEQGDPSGEYSLGNCYFYGNGVTQDYKEAFNWYKKSAEQDNVMAQNSLGDCYFKGLGIYENKKEAIKWYFKAARSNFSAQYSLGCCFMVGDGVEQNYYEAISWFKLAQEGPFLRENSQLNMGVCYYSLKKYKEAVKLLRLRGENNAVAQYVLGLCYFDGKGVIEDKEEAFVWFLLASANGYNADIEKSNCSKILSRQQIERATQRAKDVYKKNEK